MKTATREINRELVNEKEQHILEHMLGYGYHIPEAQPGYGNHLRESLGSNLGKSLLEMESRGLVQSRESAFYEGTFVFSATELGCKAIGLHDAAIKKVMRR